MNTIISSQETGIITEFNHSESIEHSGNKTGINDTTERVLINAGFSVADTFKLRNFLTLNPDSQTCLVWLPALIKRHFKGLIVSKSIEVVSDYEMEETDESIMVTVEVDASVDEAEASLNQANQDLVGMGKCAFKIDLIVKFI